MAKTKEKDKGKERASEATDPKDEATPSVDAETAGPDGEEESGGIGALSMESLEALIKDPGVTGETRERVDAEIASRKAEQELDRQAFLGKMTPMERALFVFGLEERHVAGSRQYTREDGSLGISIVTRGGRKLRWPDDEGTAQLSDMEKGDGEPKPVPAGIFPVKE